jgi:hypothetical protein
MTIGGVFVVDMASTGAFQQLRIVPMFMNTLRLERFTTDSMIWKPNEKRYERNPNKSKEFCQFINGLSKIDAGTEDRALLLEHYDTDRQIPGGPVMRTKLHRNESIMIRDSRTSHAFACPRRIGLLTSKSR